MDKLKRMTHFLLLLYTSAFKYPKTLISLLFAFHIASSKHFNIYIEGNPHGVVANILDSDITVNEFKIQSHNSIHFNTLRKGMNPLILSVVNYSATAVTLQGWL